LIDDEKNFFHIIYVENDENTQILNRADLVRMLFYSNITKHLTLCGRSTFYTYNPMYVWANYAYYVPILVLTSV